MNMFALGLALILAGVIFLALGLVNVYYNKFVFGNCEEYEAVVTKLRSIQGKSWSPYETIVPYAEYSVDGRLVEGAYYTPLIKSIVRLSVGETVTVQANPKNPKAFRIQEIEDTPEMQNVRKRTAVIVAVGAVILAVGIALIVLM